MNVYHLIADAIVRAFDIQIERRDNPNTDTITISVIRHELIEWRKIHSRRNVAKMIYPELIFYEAREEAARLFDVWVSLYDWSEYFE